MRLSVAVAVVSAVVCLVAGSRGEAADFPKGTFVQTSGEVTWALSFDGKEKFTLTGNGMDVVQGTYNVTRTKSR
jgi:hypothetical protein